MVTRNSGAGMVQQVFGILAKQRADFFDGHDKL